MVSQHYSWVVLECGRGRCVHVEIRTGNLESIISFKVPAWLLRVWRPKLLFAFYVLVNTILRSQCTILILHAWGSTVVVHNHMCTTHTQRCTYVCIHRKSRNSQVCHSLHRCNVHVPVLSIVLVWALSGVGLRGCGYHMCSKMAQFECKFSPLTYQKNQGARYDLFAGRI